MKKRKDKAQGNISLVTALSAPRNHRTHWALAEIAFVEKHYGNMPVHMISAELGRSISGIQGMAHKLGLTKPGAAQWTAQEIEILETHYNYGEGMEEVRALLPGRSGKAIRVQANRRGLVPEQSVWTLRELRYLKQHYGSMPARDIAKVLGRSVDAVRTRADICQVAKTTRRWTESELAIIRTHYRRGINYVHTLLPERTPSTIQLQANKMGLRNKPHWSDEEERIMLAFYPVMGTKVSRMLPGRTGEAIMKCAQKLGLKYQRTR